MAWFGAAPLASLFGALPDASSLAPRFDTLFNLLLLASAALVAVLVALNLTFLIRYRRGSSASRAPLRFAAWKLEAGWIAATLVVFVGFFFGGAWLYLDQERPPRGAYVIDVVGRQWMWDIRHPNGRREFDTLHVPIHTPIRLRLSSEDVIHSFFVPAFRVKQDVVPGRTISAWFEATRAGTYRLFCTQYCGTEHSGMVGEVVAMAPEDYARWLAAGNAPLNVPGRGRQLFVRYGCSGCHAASSSVHAPRLEGVYGSLQPIENRQFIRADARYLRDSILLPSQHIVAGYQNLMPSFQGTIPENDLLDLIEYLKSLANPSPAGAETPPALPPQP
jgi:cytochrome c oxidase subunit 2